MTSRVGGEWDGVRLTRRGRVVFTVLPLVLLGLVLLLVVKGCGGNTQQAVPAPVTPQASTSPVTPSASPSPTPSGSSTADPTPSASASAPQDEGTDVSGMVHTGLTGDGSWYTSSITIGPARKTPIVKHLVVKVEGGTALSANQSARQVMSVLNDTRGWTGYHGVSFDLVLDEKKADFVVYLASPGRTEKMCPLDVKMTWSCSAGRKVILNTDRWIYMTPTYHDLTAYRAYMVNHEVGHYLGFGHRPCGGQGQPAPVMLQQSKSLGGCVANAWPTPAEKG